MLSFKKLHESKSDLTEPEDFSERKAFQKKESDAAYALHDRLVPHYSNFDKDEAKNIERYTISSRHLNNHLWEKHKGETTDHDPDEDKMHEKEASDLDSSLTKNKAPESFTVWSKTRHDPRTLMNKEGIVHYPAFTSTSIRRSIAQNLPWGYTKGEDGKNHHHIIVAKIDEGSNDGAYTDHMSRVSSQGEFTLKRRINMKHIRTQSQNMGHDVYHYHEMSIV
jgi:hypothetical protein